MNKPILVFCGILLGYGIGEIFIKPLINDAKPSEPIKICEDGKLYEVTHEGNITIYDRQAFMTCEETK